MHHLKIQRIISFAMMVLAHLMELVSVSQYLLELGILVVYWFELVLQYLLELGILVACWLEYS